MKALSLTAAVFVALALLVAPNLSACVATDPAIAVFHGGGNQDLNDYGALFIDAGDPNCAQAAMSTLTAKLSSQLNSGGVPGPFKNWLDGYYVALIYGTALRLGEQGWANKDLDWQLDYSPDGHATVSNSFAHTNSGLYGIPACNPDAFNTCMDDFAGSAAAYAWMAAYKSRRIMPGHNTTADVQAALANSATYIHASFSAVCIRKLPLDESRPGPVCDGDVAGLVDGSAQTLTVNGGVQLIHYGYGLMTSVFSALQGYQMAGGTFTFSDSEPKIAKGLYEEIARHADVSGNYLVPADCLKLQNGVGSAIVGGSQCSGGDIGPSYEPNMYHYKFTGMSPGPFDIYFPGVIPDSGSVYRSTSFDESLFNVADPNAHFGYGRLVTYRDMGSAWFLPNGAPNMPFDAYDPLPGSLDVSQSGLATGWTCDQDAPDKSIRVDIYSGDPNPPTYVPPVASGYANLASESTVNAACGGGTAHRFQIQLPASAVNTPIHAFGLDYTWYGFTELQCASGPVCSYTCYTAAITSQPVSSPATITSGGSSTLTIGVGGTSPTIQWYTSGGTNVGSGSSISVSPTTTTTYYAAVSNTCTTSFNSSNVTVTVTPACTSAVITAQPAANPSTITSGSASTLTIGVSGTTPAIEWYTTSGTHVGSGSSLVVNPTVTTTYYAMVSNACTTAFSSANVTVTICAPAAITSQPTATPSAIVSGNSSTLFIGVSGSAPDIEWYTSSGTHVGAGSSITVSPTTNTTYYATVANACSSLQTSANVTVTMDLPPTASFTISCTGTTCTANASASSDDHGIASYAWLINGVPNGVTTATWTATLTTGKKTIKLTVKDTSNQPATVEQKITVTN